jgi:hypothetical protein
MSDYDTDILTWSEHQAALLRRLGAGEKVNGLIDWDNVAEEVAAVGRSQLAQVKSLLIQALAYRLKVQARPMSRDVPHWRAEALRFRIDAADVFSPGMRQRIDVGDLYTKALRIVRQTMDGQPPLPLPAACSDTLYDLLSVDA